MISIHIYIYIYPYGSKHCLRRYLTLQIIPQTLPKKVLGSIGYIYILYQVLYSFVFENTWFRDSWCSFFTGYFGVSIIFKQTHYTQKSIKQRFTWPEFNFGSTTKKHFRSLFSPFSDLQNHFNEFLLKTKFIFLIAESSLHVINGPSSSMFHMLFHRHVVS